jgi:spore germination cell wall hydrolase CwlJ-like protein
MLKHLLAIGCTAAFISGFISSESAYANDHTELDVQVNCLADNIYWEARNQPTKGMIAVALVTRNRVFDHRYPNTYCGVVKQGPTRESWKKDGTYYPIRNRCQFSWFCDGKSDTIPNQDLDVYDLARIIAFKVASNAPIKDFTKGATHYHATYVYPEWAETKTQTIKIKDHIFYRWEK